MRSIIKDDILRLLNEVKQAFDSQDYTSLLDISNHVIHDASIFQDEDTLTLAILVYAAAKIIQRCCHVEGHTPGIILDFKKAHSALASDNIPQYRKHVKEQLSKIRKHDKRLKLYIQEVIEKAKVKKASSLHRHGISLARTAELLGVSQWELQKYIGNVANGPHPPGISVRQRLKHARSLFK